MKIGDTVYFYNCPSRSQGALVELTEMQAVILCHDGKRRTSHPVRLRPGVPPLLTKRSAAKK